MKACVVCQQAACRELIHFGELPISHHFLLPGEKADTYGATLSQCAACGLLQMKDPVPPAQLVPRFDWIRYNEPEAHLDAVAEMVLGLAGVEPSSTIAGLSFNDDSLLRRLRERGRTHTWRPDMASDLAISQPHAGIETVQNRIRPPVVAALRQRYGAPNVVVARMILEHTTDPPVFLAALRNLVTPAGYVVLDVPDCGRALDCLDYTTLWEDHALYFVEATFLAALRHHGFRVEQFVCHRGPYENCLVAAVRPSDAAPEPGPDGDGVDRELQRAHRFVEAFPERCAAVREEVGRWRERGPVALFGAGHQSVMFLNLMGVADRIAFVVDDHPQKRGRRMPGSDLRILGSEALYTEGVVLCLSSLGAASEPKVISRHERFIAQGGVFASIFPVDGRQVFRRLAGQAVEEGGRLLPL